MIDTDNVVALNELDISALRDDIDKLIAEGIKNHYKQFKIRKRNGRGFRTISAPSPRLKNLQRNLLEILVSKEILWHRHGVYGFKRGKSIADNALHHRIHDKLRATAHRRNGNRRVPCRNILGKKYFFKKLDPKCKADSRYEIQISCPASAVRVDIRNAFGTIGRTLVTKAFNKYLICSSDDLERIMQICLLDGVLPQGAPTSPLLLNMALADFDLYVRKLIKVKITSRFQCSIKYSRFADDIVVTSSVKDMAPKCIGIIEGVAKFIGLELKHRKTKIMKRGSGIFITGINIVNSASHVSVSRRYRHKVRAAINECARAMDQTSPTWTPDREKMVNSILGRISYVDSIDSIHGTQLLEYAIKRKVLPPDAKIRRHDLNTKKLIVSSDKQERITLYKGKRNE